MHAVPVSLVLSLAVAGLLPVAAHAQSGAPTAPVEPRFWAAIDFVAAEPVGEFADFVRELWGFQFGGRLNRRGSALSYRIDAGILTYGEESTQVCFPLPIGCRIGAEVETTNDISFLSVGPEVRLRGGRFYLFGTVGLSHFSTTSTLSGLDSWGGLIPTEHYSDTVLSGRVGGGVRLWIRRSWRPILIDIGAAYDRNGVAQYLREGDVVDLPDGSVTFIPTRSEADFVSLRIGVAVGFGGGG